VKPADSIASRALATNARPDSSGGTWNTTLKATGLSFASGYCPRISALSTKSQIGVERLLKDRLAPYTVGPVQMVANREDDMAGLAIDTQNVNHVSLFDGHWPFYTHAHRMPTVRLKACSRGEEISILPFFRSKLI
jgi:hypothetical protein